MGFRRLLLLAVFALGFTGLSLLASFVPASVVVPFAVGLLAGGYGTAARGGRHWRELSVVAMLCGGLLVGAHLGAGYHAQELLGVFAASALLVFLCARLWAFGARGVAAEKP
jgi:hypothetical protein